MKTIIGGIMTLLVAGMIQAQGVNDAEKKEGFVSLFNGKDFTGWVGTTNGYSIEDGVIVCNRGGNFFTEKQYTDFVFRLDFVVESGANNGIALRSPLKVNPYNMMELQILDNTAPKYKKLKPYQFHGSAYGWAGAKRGFLKPVGEWNSQEVKVQGNLLKVTLNGTVILDVDLKKIEPTLPKKHKSVWNKTGHIGFLGHGKGVKFRNLRIKDLAPAGAAAAASTGELNTPPAGFTALFNGKDLTGWKGLMKGKYGNPIHRAKLSPDEAKTLQAEADEVMKKHWTIVDGILTYSGKGRSLCTAKDYADFEMMVDWKIKKGGDSGIYLRGAPQVQIWDNDKWKVGSGGLYNNKKHPSKPLVVADNPTGQWNSMRIKMVKDHVTVHLNGKLVTDTVLENCWNRRIPIFETGQIELQHHGNTLWFKNIFIREIKSEEAIDESTYTPIFDGKTLEGWIQKNGTGTYRAENGMIIGRTTKGSPNSFLCSAKEYGDFDLQFDVKIINNELNSGCQIRSLTKAPKGKETFGRLYGPQVEIMASRTNGCESGYIYGEACGGWMSKKRTPRMAFKNGEWNSYRIVAKGPRIQTWINGEKIEDLSDAIKFNSHSKGMLGLQVHSVGNRGPYEVSWKNIRIKEL